MTLASQSHLFFDWIESVGNRNNIIWLYHSKCDISSAILIFRYLEKSEERIFFAFLNILAVLIEESSTKIFRYNEKCEKMYFFQSSQFSVIKMKNPKFTFPSTGIQKIEDPTSNQVLSLHKLVVIIRQMNIFFISFLHWLSWTLIISIPIEIDSNKKASSQTNLELKCFITQNIERGIFFGSKRRNLIDSNLSLMHPEEKASAFCYLNRASFISVIVRICTKKLEY